MAGVWMKAESDKGAWLRGVGEAKDFGRVWVIGVWIKKTSKNSQKETPPERGHEKSESKQARDQDETDA